ARRRSDGNELWPARPGGGTQWNPVAAGGVVYVTGQDNRMYAIRATDGAPLWSTGDIGQMVLPAAAGGTVYVVDNNGHLAALRARDGRRLWGTSLGGGVAQGPVAAGGAGGLGWGERGPDALEAGAGAQTLEAG